MAALADSRTLEPSTPATKPSSLFPQDRFAAELDAVAFDAIDGADMHAIGADDLHVVLDALLRHGALPG